MQEPGGSRIKGGLNIKRPCTLWEETGKSNMKDYVSAYL